MSTFVAIFLTYPSDTVRRRMMMTSTKSGKYKNFLDCCAKIYQREGIRGFFTGSPVIFLQSITGASIYFVFDKIFKEIRRNE